MEAIRKVLDNLNYRESHKLSQLLGDMAKYVKEDGHCGLFEAVNLPDDIDGVIAEHLSAIVKSLGGVTMRKYTILGDQTCMCGSMTLYRIKALRDIKPANGPDIDKDDLGGYIGSESNLDQEGECWVSGEAKVFDAARVAGDAHVTDLARVYDHAQVYEGAYVYGNAEVCGYAEVTDDAEICGTVKLSGHIAVGGGGNIE